jgi:hypothetical protein
MLATNEELLLKWKATECARITNAQSAPDFFMHAHDDKVSPQPRIVGSVVHTEPGICSAKLFIGLATANFNNSTLTSGIPMIRVL